MSQPQLPVFPQDILEIGAVAVEKVARFTLVRTVPLVNFDKNAKIEAVKLNSESLGLSSNDVELLVSFFVDLWKYLVYHRLGGQSLLNVLKSSLPTLYIDTVATIWYSDGPSIFTQLARRTASDRPRVKDISWSVWAETGSDYVLEKGGDGVRLVISTDKGMKSVLLTSSEVASLHSETVRIQAEIDKLLE